MEQLFVNISVAVTQAIGIGHALYCLVYYFGLSTASQSVLFYSTHAFLFWTILSPWRLVTGIYELSIGDGALDEWLHILNEDCMKLVAYFTAFCMIYNILGTWRMIWLIFLYLVLPFSLTAILLRSSTISKELFITALPIVKWGGLKIERYIFRAVISIYLHIAESCRSRGWFIDVNPIDDDCPEYVYSALPTNRTVRILELSRKYPWGPLELKLYPYDLESCPSYEAISYTWGDLIKSRCITIDGGKLEITANAFQVISRRASYWNPKLIWIDSVCINQKDLDERGNQVQLMRELYRNASRVVVWLGEAPHFFPAIPAFQVFTFLLHIYVKINYSNLSDEELKTILQIGTNQWGWRNLFDLLHNPFWKRVWIIQEIAVATKVQLYFGGILFNWELFATIMRCLQGHSVGSLFIFTSMDNISSANIVTAIQGRDQILLISNLRDDLRQHQSLSLGSVLYSTTNFLATNPRDRVFALLGMSDIGANGAIIPNYEEEVSRIFLSTSRYLIANESDPFCSLHRAGIGYKRHTKYLPSWVVDWDTGTSSKSLWRDPDLFPYQASKGHGGHIRCSESSQTICVTGFQFDEIKNYARPRELNPESRGGEGMVSHGQAMQDGLVETCMLANLTSSEPYRTGQSRFEALWRCLVGDRNRLTFDRPADPRVGESFYAVQRVGLAARVFNAQGVTEEEIKEKIKMVYPERQWHSAEEAAQNIAEEDAKTRLFQGSTTNSFVGRKFANTRSGYYALVPPLAEVGDIICLIDGAQTPFVLRRDAGGVQLVGECYVHGIMDGEIAGDGVRETFVLY